MVVWKTILIIIVAISVVIILISILAEFFFGVKIVRLICSTAGLIIYSQINYEGVLSGLTQSGLLAACNQLPY